MRRTPLRRKGWMNRVSERQRTLNAEFRRTRRMRAESVEYRCEARIPGVCDGYGCHAHHVVRRSQGGTNGVENLRWVCAACHSWIHGHPEQSRTLGLLERAMDHPRPVGLPLASPEPAGGAVLAELLREEC